MSLFKKSKLRIALHGAVAIGFVSCGAPLKKADEVGHIFEGNENLGDKMTGLCQMLSQRQEAPNLQNIRIDQNSCNQAGLLAQDLKNSQDLFFASVRQDGATFAPNEANNDVLTLETRSELWLNRDILRLVRQLFPYLKKQSDNIVDQGGKAQGEGEQKEFQINILGKPVFNKETYEIQLRFELVSTKAQNGQVDIQNTFVVHGQLVDKKYAVATIETLDVAPVERSLLKSGKLVIFIVPHAKDVYMDVFTNIVFHSFGVDQAMKDQITGMISKGLKAIPKFLDDAEKGGG